MKALPALAECDIVSFGSAIKELQAHLGDYFAPVQGGSRFSSPDVAAALASARERRRRRHRAELLGPDRVCLCAIARRRPSACWRARAAIRRAEIWTFARIAASIAEQ